MPALKISTPDEYGVVFYFLFSAMGHCRDCLY